MNLEGVHLLLTYQCLWECDHCFVWSSPSSEGVMTLEKIRGLLPEIKKLGTVKWICIEGGEPFLYYPIMVKTVKWAAKVGFKTEIVTNAYWANALEDALEWLRPIAEAGITDILISSDPYHREKMITKEAKIGVKAAEKMNVKVNLSAVDTPLNLTKYPSEVNGAKVYKTEVMYRGRAATKLLEGAPRKPWTEFIKCPYEDLASPKRVHLDPLGYVHLCQGISMGNAWERPFSEIVQSYDPVSHQIIGPLLDGGPVALVRKFNLPHEETYADACHLCYIARLALRARFPKCLTPGQMYGEMPQS